MKRRQAGFGLVEVVLGMGVASLMVLVAMGYLRWHLESILTGNLADAESLSLGMMIESMEKAWDQRSGHVLQEGPWLVIEGERLLEETRLERLWMRSVGPSGNLVTWEWAKESSGWQARLKEPSSAGNQLREWALDYEGDIIINQAPGTFMGGEAPSLVRMRFPDAVFDRHRQGFAFGDNW